MNRSDDAPIGLLLSGGLDSSILLWHLIEQGRRVQPLYVQSHLFWQQAELRAVGNLLSQAASSRLGKLVTLELPLADVYGDHWSVTGRGVPHAESDDEAVYLPGRNPLLIIKARLWCQLHGISQLALGCLHTSPFSDATDEFFAQFADLLDQAAGGRVQLVRPLGQRDKRGVMQLGRGYPLRLTFSCLAPCGTLHCGRCNKCAERRRAFALAARCDETRYADGQRPIAVGEP